MSIVRPSRRDWLFNFLRTWMLALVGCGVATGLLRTAAADDPPSEPAEYIIISDDQDAAGSDPAKPSAEESASKTEKPVNRESDQSNGEQAETTDASKSSDEVASEESPDDEVAPLEISDTESNPSKDETSELQPTEAREANEDDSVAGASSEDQSLAIEQAGFEGVYPGKTTVEELEEGWGPATEVRKAGSRLQKIYDFKSYKQVVVTIVDKKVDTIVLSLEKPVDPAVLSEELSIGDVESATIYNDKGQMLGQAYPERGVLFGFAPQASPIVVAQVVIEPINSQPFVTRAEKNLSRNLTKALADIEYAIKIDPEYDRAHTIYARVLCEMGQFKLARREAEKAAELVDNDIEHRITLAKALFHAADYEQAALTAEKVISDETATELFQAEAHCIWGDTLACGSDRAFDKAIKHHTEAIRLAEIVSRKNYGPVRRAAKELLVDAHLAVARDIAWGNWQQKAKVVPKWIERAHAFCETLTRENGSDLVKLRVHEQTLAIYAGLKTPPSIESTMLELNEIAPKLLADEINEGRRCRMQWELGEAMAAAMQVFQAQDKSEFATQAGENALVFFKQAEQVGEEWPSRNLVLGQVYYRLGAIEAIHGKQHQRALEWYDQAAPLLEAPIPACLCDLGRQGEIFVSMAVSYWETGKHEEAVRLTFQGVKLIEDAVSHNQLPKTALAVPYGNLSSMHQELGHKAQAKEYSEMASRYEGVRR